MQEVDRRNQQLMLLTGPLLVLTRSAIFPKEIVCILTSELERRLKLKADKIGLFLRHLYGYNSVSIYLSLEPATPLRLAGRWN